MIQTTEVSITYKGDGVQTSFPYPYPYRNSDDIVGYIINDVGYETRITNNFKYDKVSNIYQYPLAGDPLAAPYSIKLIRETPQQQNADLPGKLPFSLIEKSLDWIIMILQEIGSRCNSLWHIRNDCKLSETNARNSANAAAESEENAANSENLAKKWAMSPVSPDGVVDTNSPTGYTQSAKTWAALSKEYAGLSKFKLPIGYYDSVAEMKASETAFVGRPCVTLGYNAPNDGGGAVYIIRSKKESDVDDGGSIIFLDNGNVSELIIDEVINVKQFGAVGNGKVDDTNALNAALQYADKVKVHSSTLAFTTPDPSHTLLGINVYIPRGEYKLSSPLIVPDSTMIFGDGMENTFLHFTSTYGMVLKGSEYNGERYFSRGIFKRFAINMNGNGVGISNIKYQTSSRENNSLQDCIFDNILVINADIGIALLGKWNNTFNNVRVRFCKVGVVSDVNNYVGGNNNNSYYNLAISSCSDCGLYTNDSAGTFINLNVEGINSELNPYSGNKLTFDNFELQIKKPCGVFITKKANVLFTQPWFERIYDTTEGIKACAFWINETSHIFSDIIPDCSIKITKPMFNNDVSRGIHVSSSAELFLEKPFGTYSDLFYIDFKDASGTYIFNTIKSHDIDIINSAAKSVMNNFKFINVRFPGSIGEYDTVLNTKTSEYNIHRINIGTNNGYALNKILDTRESKVIDEINNKMYLKANIKNGFVQLPQNRGTVTVQAGDTSATIPFGVYLAEGEPVVKLVAHDKNGMRLLAGGYYVTGTGNSIDGYVTVHFSTPSPANILLSYFCIG